MAKARLVRMLAGSQQQIAHVFKTMKVPARRYLRTGATAAALGLVAILLPHLIGANWSQIAQTAAAIPAPVAVLLLVLWAVGLLAHTITLTAAMPGLSHRRALMLSLTGSAVANVLPLGGAAGIALNENMTRHWGFSRKAFASYTVVSNVWDVLAKLLMPLVLLLPLLALGGTLGHQVVALVAGSALLVTVVGGLVAALIFSPVLPRLSGRIDGSAEPGRWRSWLNRALVAGERVRAHSVILAKLRWKRLTLGMVLYTALLFALLLTCLWATGAAVPLVYVLVAFCGERLLTLVGLTPGAVGFVEVGLAAALLLAPTASGAGVAAGVLLYRLLTFALEIPTGGALLGWWFWRTERRAPRRLANIETSEVIGEAA